MATSRPFAYNPGSPISGSEITQNYNSFQSRFGF